MLNFTSKYISFVRMILEIQFAFIIILCESSIVFALNPQKTIAQYGHSIWIRENGLPANGVNAVLQTRDGYIWLGTTSGLFRFDGVAFNEVSTNPEIPGLHESISVLCETRDGSLWIGTQFKGLRRLKDGKIYPYGLKEGFYNTAVYDFFETHNGHLLISTGMGFFEFNEGKSAPILVDPTYSRAIAEDSLGRIWVGTYEGIKIFDGAKLTQQRTITTADGLPNNLVTDIFTDRQSNVWIGTFSGLAKWHNGKIKVYNTNNGLSHYHVNAIYGDHDGNLWVGTRGGIDRLYGNKWTTYTVSDGLTDNDVLSFAEDHEGSLWVCTSDGLNQFKDVGITVYSTSEGLANNHVSSIVETPDRSLYFLSDQGSNVTKLKDGKIDTFNIPVGPAYVAHDGSLWIGQNGLLFNIKNDKLKRYDTRSGLPSKWISAITEDNKSLIIYADHTDIFRFVDGRLEPYLMANGQQYHSPEKYIVCFYPQSDSVLWIGGADSLAKIQNGKITGFTTADGLAGNWITSIYDDHKGSLWISSPQGGLTRYRDGKFTAFNTKIGLFNDEIYCVLGDDYGGLWLSSAAGIGYLRTQELNDYAEGRTSVIHSKVYSTADGMKTNECFGDWQPAGWKAHDGNIWFATSKGAVLIDPKAFKQNKLQPPVVIEQVVMDGKTVPSNHFVRLSPGTKNLEFHYTALSFLVPERVLFKYKLEGYDHEWVDAGTRRTAYYTNLPPGTYRFQVMACNNDGVWNETGASFSFELLPHFYETYWFYGLLFLFICGVAFGIYRLRVWQFLEREKELSVRIQEALASIRTLSGLIPICSNCKKIRGDKGYWEHLEKYIQTHSDAKFSHGLCPECMKNLYPEFDKSSEGKITDA